MQLFAYLLRLFFAPMIQFLIKQIASFEFFQIFEALWLSRRKDTACPVSKTDAGCSFQSTFFIEGRRKRKAKARGLLLQEVEMEGNEPTPSPA